ncbi:HAD family hydrolase [Natronolimnohabitans innermongolicus]|uniref:HAD-superfamily hydrolase n=1 Tax=Natronolimnohabitans innermongolicus JCM 12255 TaxID=1227499 RepID=L9X835_9EURY|nr:HAD family hydrolase [Natronolimnohabitans innermongolicus]ELY57571.1 HAD-superfamily hydrolase [Natronolimnohabitans innermongolicus JCM 12255]
MTDFGSGRDGNPATAVENGVVDTVCFDLDHTLCRYTRPGSEILSRAFERVGLETDAPWTVDDYYGRYRTYLEESSGADDLRRRCFADLAVDAGYDRETGRAVADAYGEYRDREAVEPLPGARNVLETLATENQLGLITNGEPGMQRAKLEATGLDAHFETVVYAGYDTAAKPSAEPFERALDALGSTPDRAVYVGNSLASDVAGARAAGMQSVWVPHGQDVPETPDPTPTYRLEGLAELSSPPW